MPEGTPLLRRVAWLDLCPWLILFRSFRVAISLPALFLATAGAIITPAGWIVGRALFVRGESETVAAAVSNATTGTSARVNTTNLLQLAADGAAGDAAVAALSVMPTVYWRFVEPFARLADRRLTISLLAYFLFGGIWNIAVWAFLAGSITRLAALRLGREEQLSLSKAVRHAVRHYVWYFSAPFFPLMGIVLIAVPIALLGVIMRLSVGAAIAVLGWPLVLVGGLLMAILLTGVLLGWPLMWPTISSEQSSDAFEAFSRSFSYTFQRPLYYLFLAVITVVFGGLGSLFVSEFASAVTGLAQWAASWGAGAERWNNLSLGETTGLDRFAGSVLWLANYLVAAVVAGFDYSFFLCAATAAYLVLRRAVDQTEFDEVFSEDDDQRFGLPDLRTAGEAKEEPEVS